MSTSSESLSSSPHSSNNSSESPPSCGRTQPSASGTPQPPASPNKKHKATPQHNQKQQQQEMRGGLLFALGITWMVSTEYVVLREPQVLPYLYIAQIVPLLLYRCVTYYQQHLQHYTLELCYFTNALLVLYILAFPKSQVLFLICYGLLHGPVLVANVVYKCSLLMSDVQRFITWHMHVMPVIVVFCLRWLPSEDARLQTCHDEANCLYTKSPYLLLVLSLAATVGHTIVYNVYIWRLAPASTRNHPEYDNSFLYFVRRIEGSGLLDRVLNCFGPRGRLLSFTLCTQLFNAMVITMAYACWVNLEFNLCYILCVIFVTAYYAGSFYSHVAGKAAAASKVAPLVEDKHSSNNNNTRSNEAVAGAVATGGGIVAPVQD